MPRKYDPRFRNTGPKPRDPKHQAESVQQAVLELEQIGAVFTVADVAERAGVSRATIYRNADLRAAVGAKGDAVRMVDPAVHAHLTQRHAQLRAKVSDVRRQLQESEQSWQVMRDRALAAEQRVQTLERRLETLADHQARLRNLGNASALESAAKHLDTDAIRRARRILARALHPDLFSHDPGATVLATELLKALNALAE